VGNQQALFKQLGEAAGQIATKDDVKSPDLVQGIIDTIEDLTGLDLSGLHDIVSAIESAIGGLTDIPTAIFNSIVDAINQFIADLLSLLDAATGGIFNLDALAAALNRTHSVANSAVVAASAAQGTADNAQSTATAAQTAASNAASVAATAASQADIAYNFATYREKEFSVATSGLVAGTNEQLLGITIPVPPSTAVRITRVTYTSKTNLSTLLRVKLHRVQVDSTDTVILTTDVTGGATTFPDASIDYPTTDLDHFYCEVDSVNGAVTALNCMVEYVILDAS
jgi:hypothetical protein